MGTLRRLFRVVRGRRLVAVGLFLVLTYLFANNLDPTPRFALGTQPKLDRVENLFERPSLQAVSTDGLQVILRYESNFHHGGITRVELWDLESATNLTPAHWRTEEWRNLVNRGWWYADGRGLLGLASDPAGQKFLRDEAAWAALGQRLNAEEAKSNDASRIALRDHLHFSPDGQFIAYTGRIEWPVPEFLKDLGGTWTVVEDAFTGEQIAVLPTGREKVAIAPGGGTAASRRVPRQYVSPCVLVITGGLLVGEVTEEPTLLLWDLKTKSLRSRLILPGKPDRLPEYSPDGRYVFANSRSPSLLRWWEVETGKRVGEIIDPPTHHFLGGGRVLLVQSSDPELLHSWDVTTGSELPDWELPPPPKGTGEIGQVAATAGDRYVAMVFSRDGYGKNPDSIRIVDELVEELPSLPVSRDRAQIMVLDAVERRVVGKVPGRSAAFSADGRWLATINSEGVVRVWEVPFGRPWGRGSAYAAALVFGAWLLIALIGKVRRRLWRRRGVEHDAPGEFRDRFPLPASGRGLGGGVWAEARPLLG